MSSEPVYDLVILIANYQPLFVFRYLHKNRDVSAINKGFFFTSSHYTVAYPRIFVSAKLRFDSNIRYERYSQIFTKILRTTVINSELFAIVIIFR